MRKNHFLTAFGLLVFFLLCLVPSGNAQATVCVPMPQPLSAPWQLGLTCSFTSTSTSYGAFSAKGIVYWQIFSTPNGTIASAALSIDSSPSGLSSSWSTGGVLSSSTIGSLASAALYQNATATTPTNYAQLTPTISGSGTLTVTVLGYTNPPLSTGGGGVSSNVTVTNSPSVGQGNAAALAGSWPQKLTDGTNGPVAVKPASTAAVASDPSLVAALSPNSPLPAGSNAIGGVTVSNFPATQPVSLASAPTTPVQPAGFSTQLTNQLAVTATAGALPSNATQHFACVKALSTNTISVFAGSSGVTTSTGYELAPGDGQCWFVTNTNQLYVIASTTGASVSWTAQ